MNKFELFTMIYYALDAYYDSKIDDDKIQTLLSDMNPFIWVEECSGDPEIYSEYLRFIGDRSITVDNSLRIAKEYLKTVDYVNVTPALDGIDKEKWSDYCKEYLSEPHKGGEQRYIE